MLATKTIVIDFGMPLIPRENESSLIPFDHEMMIHAIAY